ncbi:MAG: hypothetical protein KDE46_04765, partial [Caldilineaceae bacterium]|nr:hypothetical protein [Caldilineaceae bacterium]
AAVRAETPESQSAPAVLWRIGPLELTNCLTKQISPIIIISFLEIIDFRALYCEFYQIWSKK